MQTHRNQDPIHLARFAGAMYVFIIATGAIGILTLDRLLVTGDEVRSAANLLSHQSMVQLAIASSIIGNAVYLAITGIFYVLFRPVSRWLSFAATLFSAVGCAVGAIAMLFVRAPLLALNGSISHSIGDQATRSLAYLLTRFYLVAFDTGMIFFGFYCVVIGWLIARSRFLPRILGLGMAVGGAGYLTFLWPPLAQSLFPFNGLAGLVGEGALTVWLLVAGVNAEGWWKQATLSSNGKKA